MTPNNTSAGYTLTETLAALAIASLVTVTVMAGLADIGRTARRANQTQQAMLEVRNIEANLRAGVPSARITERYPDWSLSLSPVDRPVDPRTGAVLTLARLSHEDLPGFDYSFVYLEPGRTGAGR
ncbi:type II secretion system protein [Maricaulis sp.]|uniref:PulJ/GspJ family protein n=1 Tax=Maricaulis sp. TaxID=1486257 RepID=UPI001B1F30A9|nr:type II secretion system protein [Maricaulis sp.]MBO6797773.1 type II secretion system protein [Maricaulis sp.]